MNNNQTTYTGLSGSVYAKPVKDMYSNLVAYFEGHTVNHELGKETSTIISDVAYSFGFIQDVPRTQEQMQNAAKVMHAATLGISQENLEAYFEELTYEHSKGLFQTKLYSNELEMIVNRVDPKLKQILDEAMEETIEYAKEQSNLPTEPDRNRGPRLKDVSKPSTSTGIKH